MRSLTRRLLLAATAGAVAAALAVGPAAALAPAAEPHDIGTGSVVDETSAGVEQDGMAAAIDRLASRSGIRLSVVFVDDFGTRHPIDWADETALASGRTGTNDLLLAVAVTQRGYGVSADAGIGLSEPQLEAAERADLVPRLQQNDWAGAVVAYAAAIGDLATGEDTGSAAAAGGGGDSPGWILPVVGTALLALIGGALLVAWMRGRRRSG